MWYPVRPTAGPRTALVLGMVGAAATASCARAGPAPEAESLGAVAFGVACAPDVQADFDRAVALLHHMTYPAAEAAFRSVTERDPACALGYWGRAMTLFQPLWPTRPGAEELARGWTLMQEARRRVAAPGREAMFVAAGEAFFDPSDDPDYWTRIQRWAAATALPYQADTTDVEAAAFHALAALAVASRSTDPAAAHAAAAALLSGILARAPTHPGAVHYTIHANDFDGRARESLDVVRRYGDIAPRNPHALHMPTHIFVRLGAWNEAIDWNLRAADAALAQRVGPDGAFVWDEFPHAGEYLVYAYLQRGDDASALAALRRVADTPDLDPTFKTAFHLASMPTRYAVERQDWRAAAALPARTPAYLEWDRFPWPEAVVWFARGLGSAHLGAEAAVQESLDRLAVLSAGAAGAGEPLFAAQIEILRLEVAAWQAFAAGGADQAQDLLEQAVALEGRSPKHPVTPGATLPAGELLGDLRMALGDAAGARAAYRASNDRIPGRLNTLLGLARSSDALGDPEAARGFYTQLVEGVAPASTRPGVLEARAYLAR